MFEKSDFGLAQRMTMDWMVRIVKRQDVNGMQFCIFAFFETRTQIEIPRSFGRECLPLESLKMYGLLQLFFPACASWG